MKKKIAVLCCGWDEVYLQEFFEGVKQCAKENNADVYIFASYNYTEFSGYPNYIGFSIFRLINYEDYDGVIILTDTIKNPRALEMERQRILKSGKPAVSINVSLSGLSCIKLDRTSEFKNLILHLIDEHNVTDIMYATSRGTDSETTNFYEVFRSVLQSKNIEFTKEKLISIEDADYQNSFSYAKTFFKETEKLPQAIVCQNDYIALAFLNAAEEAQIKVPEQLKITGHGNIPFARNQNVQITSVSSEIDKLGSQAVRMILAAGIETKIVRFPSKFIKRNSCGCQLCETQENKKMHLLQEISSGKQFVRQMNGLEEIFLEATDVFTLLTNLEIFFNKSHEFEGSNFCVFLKSDWSSILINSEDVLPQNLSYGTQVQAIASIQNNVKYPREIINTRDLIPSKMKNDQECSTYLFLPIFHHSYVHGYYVCKNNLALIKNNYGFVWTKTFGNSIEHFRRRNMYKQMSQQFFKLSVKDALSGMMNRIGMDKLAKPFYQANKKNGLTTVLFFVDINSMKTINDKFGHLHGDLAVKTIAAAILTVMPKNWLCIRYGGDEFLIVGNSKNYNGEDYCTAIQQTIAKKTATMQLPYTLSASVGTYSVPPTSTLTLEQAIEKVDEIMYEKKQAFHKTH